MYFKKNRGKWEILVDNYSTLTLTPCQMEILQVKNIMIRTNNLLQYFISRLEIAKEKNIEIEFKEVDLGDAHPNTVKFIIEDIDGVFHEIVGSSIGGGSIKITEVNGSVVEFTGEYPTLIISHKDIPGAVSKVTAIVYEHNINIAFMKVFRTERGKAARMVFEMDSPITKDIIDEIKKVEAVEKLVVINPVKEDI